MNTSSPESVTVSQASKPADLENAPEANPPTAPSSPLPDRPVRKPQRRPRASKISRLPAEIREFINQSIYDHISYPSIIQSLTEKGHPGINRPNLTAWVKSGYKLWREERERLNALRLVSEDSEKMFRELDADGKHHADRLGRILINMHIVQAIRDLDPAPLKEEMRKDPRLISKFAHANHAQCLSRQRDDRLDVLRHKAGIGRKTGPSDFARQSAKVAFNLPDSWFNSSNNQKH